MTTPRVALIGANGHGRWHRRQLRPLHEAGRLRLVALCDVNPVTDAEDAPVPAGATLHDDYRDLLAKAEPDVVVIVTPPHTHLEIATAAARAGADLLLEKPPVMSRAEHNALAAVLAETGRACQIGFQALASPALAELVAAVAGGRLGEVTGVAAVGAWQRPDSYYTRAPWAGRRWVNGRPVIDGALANPFAHALMQALAISAATPAGADPCLVEVERYRARPIETDDTTSLRVTVGGGLPVVAAVTLCSESFVAGEIVVHGGAGRAVLEYPTDRLMLPGETGLREVPGRASLLENLLDHRASGGAVPLIAPLSRTAAFTDVLEAMLSGPDPTDVPAEYVTTAGEAPERITTITGVNDAVHAAGDRLALFSELDVAWAVAPHRTTLPPSP